MVPLCLPLSQYQGSATILDWDWTGRIFLHYNLNKFLYLSSHHSIFTYKKVCQLGAFPKCLHATERTPFSEYRWPQQARSAVPDLGNPQSKTAFQVPNLDLQHDRRFTTFKILFFFFSPSSPELFWNSCTCMLQGNQSMTSCLAKITGHFWIDTSMH